MRLTPDFRRIVKNVSASLAAIAFLTLAAFPLAAAGRDEPTFQSIPDVSALPKAKRAAEAAALASGLVEAMSDEEALSQLLMVGYEGAYPQPELLEWIRARGIGGVKIFGWNAEDTTRLAAAIAALQEASLARGQGIPALVATDQEGGWIRHVKGRTSESPGNMAIGASGIPYDAYMSGLYIGRELLTLGITMNFAPVVDLATRPDSTIIGPRAFSDDPMTAAVLGSAYAKGLGDSGVIATAKHFPGHGDTELDSHGSLPLIRADLATLLDRELVPYRMMIAEGLQAVMSGHIAFPEVTGSDEPASLSRSFMTDILREKLGFGGVAVTDDMYMYGVSGDSGVAEACRKAILAGNDMLVLSTAPVVDGAIWKTLTEAMRSDPEFSARVRESARRVVALKIDRLKPLGREALVPKSVSAEKNLPAPGAAEFFRALAYRSATILTGADRLPFKPSGKTLVAGPFGDFLDAAKAAWPGAAEMRFSYLPAEEALPGELAVFSREAAKYDAVVVCVANRAGLQFAQAAKTAGAKVAILSVLSPVHVKGAVWAEAAVAVYSHAGFSIRAGIDVLSGKIKAYGRVPLAGFSP